MDEWHPGYIGRRRERNGWLETELKGGDMQEGLSLEIKVAARGSNVKEAAWFSNGEQADKYGHRWNLGKQR